MASVCGKVVSKSENREKSSIDINEIIKKVIYIGIGAVVTALLSGIIKWIYKIYIKSINIINIKYK